MGRPPQTLAEVGLFATTLALFHRWRRQGKTKEVLVQEWPGLVINEWENAILTMKVPAELDEPVSLEVYNAACPYTELPPDDDFAAATEKYAQAILDWRP
jgi:hypothetical protein